MVPITTCRCKTCGYVLPQSGAPVRCPWCGATTCHCDVDITDELPTVYGKPMSWGQIVSTMRAAFADLPWEQVESDVAAIVASVRQEIREERGRLGSQSS